MTPCGLITQPTMKVHMAENDDLDDEDITNESSTSSKFVSLPNIEKYKSEAARLATFDAWTYPHPAPKDFAKSGLCYLGQRDAVQCAFCKKIIFDWLPEYLPKKVHGDMSPNCPFVQGQDVGNIPSATNQPPPAGKIHNKFYAKSIPAQNLRSMGHLTP